MTQSRPQPGDWVAANLGMGEESDIVHGWVESVTTTGDVVRVRSDDPAAPQPLFSIESDRLVPPRLRPPVRE